jgi:hypothetical protein
MRWAKRTGAAFERVLIVLYSYTSLLFIIASKRRGWCSAALVPVASSLLPSFLVSPPHLNVMKFADKTVLVEFCRAAHATANPWKYQRALEGDTPWQWLRVNKQAGALRRMPVWSRIELELD